MTQDRSETDAVLADWTSLLAGNLGLSSLDVDIEAVLALAGEAAHGVVRPAAPLTTFLVGYAAGLAAAGGVNPSAAVEAASGIAQDLVKSRPAAG